MELRASVRRPAFGRHGRKVVAFLCAWELVALPNWSPIPTVSETVDRHPWLGMILLLLLAHHWYVELEQQIADLIDDPDFTLLERAA